MNYYNEWDKGAAAWLRELIKAGLIPNGYVDERSITEVTPGDLEGFTQCHFFAGIGGWSRALQLAGVPATVPLWTGSPPCQPFSVAGKQLGSSDPRHLAPAFLELVAQCRPSVIFGEQVAAAIGKNWLDALLIELEEQGYTCGAAVLPAASVGAPHKRDRLFFGAHLQPDNAGDLANALRRGRQQQSSERPTNVLGKEIQSTECELQSSNARATSCSMAQPMRTERDGKRLHGLGESYQTQGSGTAAEFTGRGDPVQLADTNDTRPQRRRRVSERADQQSAGAAGVAGGMGYAEGSRRKGGGLRTERRLPPCGVEEASYTYGPANPHHSFWSDADWLGCRDGKFRPVIASFISLVDGFSDSMGCGGYPRIRESSEVFKLPEGVSAEAFFFRRTGKPVNAEAQEILRSKMHGEGAGRDKGADASELSQAVGEDFDRSLYELSEEGRADARTSQGREPFKQRAIELDDLMCELSRQSTLAELQQRNYDAQALLTLRDACAEKWAVQYSFVAVESVWSSFSEEDKARERVDFNAGIWRRVEFFPLSSGEEGRVGRLRGYGNAIVPQVAAEFVKAFNGVITDAGN